MEALSEREHKVIMYSLLVMQHQLGSLQGVFALTNDKSSYTDVKEQIKEADRLMNKLNVDKLYIDNGNFEL